MNIMYLRQGTIVLGALFIIIGIACNIMFYWDLAESVIAKLVYITLGTGFDAFKIMLLPIAFVLFAILNRPLLGTICVLTWAGLTLISLIAAYGFFTNVQDNLEKARLKDTLVYQSAATMLASSQQNISKYQPYAEVDDIAVQAEITRIREAINTRQQHPYFNDHNPINKQRLQTEINQLNQQLSPLLAQVDGAKAYQAAIQNKQLALTDLSAMDKSQMTDEIFSAVFVSLGKMLDISADAAKRRVLIITSFATEFLSTLCAVLVVVFTHSFSKQPQSSHNPMSMEVNPRLQRSKPPLQQLNTASLSGVNIPLSLQSDNAPKW